MVDKKRPLAIVLGITSTWAFAAGTVLLGLKKYKPRYDYDVIIYHQNLSDKNMQILQQIHPCIFVAYDTGLVTTNRFTRVSKMTFSRYECLGLLDKYKKVLWLDADVLVKGDISGLVESGRSGFAMYKHKRATVSDGLKGSFSGYDTARKSYNAGVFLVTDMLADFTKLKKWCYEKTNLWVNEIITADQAIINLLLQEYNLTISELDVRYNCPPAWESPQTIILHPWGKQKFWDGAVHPLWDKYYFQWCSLGGDGPVMNRGFVIRLTVLRILDRELIIRFPLYSWISQHFISIVKKAKTLLS